jgi:PAS domain S-box-containing protein
MSKKALIVDNDFFFIEFLTELLVARGYDVIKACDGKDGISKLEEGLVDFIFTEMILPKIDGVQFIKFVRKKFPDARIPIIAVAGNLIEQFNELKNIGADYYIAKGSTTIMADHINRLLDKLENPSLPPPDDGLLVPGKLFPRRPIAALMDSVSFERSILQSVGMGILVVDTDAKIIRTNSLALEILGKPFEEVLNQHVTALFPATEKVKLMDALRKVLHHPTVQKIYVYVSMESQTLRMIISCNRIEDEITGWVIAMEEAAH